MKKINLLMIALIIPLAAPGRLVPSVRYQGMYDRADLVAIGKPSGTRDTKERGGLPGGPTGWLVVGLSTEFDISLVLKGERDLKRCILHHYRQSDPGQLLRDGPHFISFAQKGSKPFLLFLKRESDGRFAPVSGQEDPALFSVLELTGEAN
jgi:hypothetical protein